jgi:UDP-N-acetylmuramoyl-L-alanyl-D-glutamate--2,6-diaminopimelate ligase
MGEGWGGAPSDLVLSGLTLDSRQARPGFLFAALAGNRQDGAAFIADAVGRGAVAILAAPDAVLPPLDPSVVVIRDANPRRRVALMAAAFAGVQPPCIAAVTGTNGKSSTVHFVRHIWTALGLKAASVGTLGIVSPCLERAAGLTTPDPVQLHEDLAILARQGVTHLAIEASSHGLDQHRLDGLRLSAACFTNLTHEHLDYHASMDTYFAAKARLFEPQFTALGIVNLDDVRGQLLADVATIALVGFGHADAIDLVVGADRHTFRWRGRDVIVPLGGRFNVSNSLAAATTAEALGIGIDAIVTGLGSVAPVPGRFESVDLGQPFHVVVDYAHTPDGLQVALESAREAVAGGRVIVVFGCGGDRDAEKRPLMGRVAAELADLVVVTSDNPRSEDPLAIIAAVLHGVPDEYLRSVTSEPDRRAAIGVALGAARPGDMVVLAGKGHEATQTIGAAVLPFDDRAVARELLEQLT